MAASAGVMLKGAIRSTFGAERWGTEGLCGNMLELPPVDKQSFRWATGQPHADSHRVLSLQRLGIKTVMYRHQGTDDPVLCCSTLSTPSVTALDFSQVHPGLPLYISVDVCLMLLASPRRPV